MRPCHAHRAWKRSDVLLMLFSVFIMQVSEQLWDCEQLSHCPGSVCQPSPRSMWECRTCVWALRSRVLECVCNRSACLQEDKTTLVGHQGPDVQRCTPGGIWMQPTLWGPWDDQGQIPHIVLHSFGIQRRLQLSRCKSWLCLAQMVSKPSPLSVWFQWVNSKFGASWSESKCWLNDIK